MLRFDRDQNQDQDLKSQAPSVVAENLEADDFTIAREGTVYLATHHHNSVVALDTDGARHEIAGAAQGIVGATSVEVAPKHPGQLLLTTTGGMRGLERHGNIPAPLLRLRLPEKPSPRAAGNP